MRSVALAAALTILAPCSASLAAPTYSFVSLDVSNSVDTYANGINNAGQVVGSFYDGSSVRGGFLFNPASGSYTLLKYPTRYGSVASGINNLGQVVGNFTVAYDVEYGTHSSYVFNSATGSLTTLPNASANGTLATGINDSGQIVGTLIRYYYQNGSFLQYTDSIVSFLRDPVTGNYTYLRFGSDTVLGGINNFGKIVGYYTTPTAFFLGSSSGGTDYSFVYDPTTGSKTFIADPLATQPLPDGDPTPPAGGTDAYGINDLGQVVGSYQVNLTSSTSLPHQGFVYDPASGSYTDLNYPGAYATIPTGINDAGQIVGYYQTTALHQYLGFVATPVPAAAVPEPSSLILLGIGSGCIWLGRRERLGHVVRRARALFDGVLA